MDEVKKEVGEIIDRLATIFEDEDREDAAIKEEINTLGERLKVLTGKTIEECQPFEAYWSYTTLEDIVDGIMAPETEMKDLSGGELSDDELIEKIKDFFEKATTLGARKLDKLIREYEDPTGLDNFSDYIFWPDSIEGLGKNSSEDEIIKKILEDRKR